MGIVNANVTHIKLSDRTIIVNKRKRIMQNANNNARTPSEKEVKHAMGVIQGQMNALRKRLHGASAEETTAIQQEIHDLLKSVGLETVEVEVRTNDDTATPPGVGAKIAMGISNATEAAAKINAEAAAAGGHLDPKEIDVTVTDKDGSKTTTKTTIETEKPGLWARFKAWVVENKKKSIAGALTVLAGAAGLWYWVSGKNTNVTVSSGVTEVAIETPTDTTPAVEPGIFTRMGAWIVDVAVAAKDGVVSGWNWVKGLFTRNTNTEATVEATPEVTVAAA